MRNIPYLSAAISLAVICQSCAPQSSPPATVSHLDKASYAGEWHEIGRLPNPFEKNLVAARATYGANADGTISVRNDGMKADGSRTSIQGTATPDSSGSPGRLLVRFDEFPANIFAGDYWILDVNPAYTRALVGSPDRKFLWLLSKNPGDTRRSFSRQITIAEKRGYDTSRIIYNSRRIPN